MKSPQAPLVEFRNVGLRFGSTVVHKDLNFSLYPGEVTTILGPSGAGKTMILKLIIGLLFATQGSVLVEGRDMNQIEAKELPSVRAHIGMLFQGAALFDSLSVFENIAYGLRERGEKNEDRLRAVVEEKLQLVGLSGFEKKYPSLLSGGQKKRVGLARALATSPKIMLFDEPTTGLDPTSTRMIDDLILMLKKDHGMTCLAVTHDIQSAARISDRWILISEGIVQADGPTEQVARNNAVVVKFINGQWGEDV